MKNIAALFIATALLSCGSQKKTIQTETTMEKKVTTLWVNSYLGACEKGNEVSSVLLTQNNAQIDAEAWECNFQPITGFDFEVGYIYQLETKTVMKEGLPATELVQVVSKERDPNYFKIYDIWSVTHIDGIELAKEVKHPSFEVNLTTMKIMGNGACNNYTGKIMNYTTSKIAFGPIAGTKMMCGDIKTETSFFAALQKTRRFEVKENALIFYDLADKPLIQFKKVD